MDTRTFPATPASLATLQMMLASHGVVVDLMQCTGRAQAEDVYKRQEAKAA